MKDKGDWRLKLLDVGSVKALEGGEELLRPRGTEGYMAPEMVHEAGWGQKAEVWSAGVVLAELTVETHLRARFQGASRDVVDRVLREKESRCDRPLREFLTALLEPDPALRPTSAEALQLSYLDDESTADTASSAASSPARA